VEIRCILFLFDNKTRVLALELCAYRKFATVYERDNTGSGAPAAGCEEEPQPPDTKRGSLSATLKRFLQLFFCKITHY